jgi:Domain of unknown function (DUF4259)
MPVGTWDHGPFDNDSAADWCGDLNGADLEKWPELIEETLRAAVDETGYLDGELAERAIAAAAVVAATQPNATPVDSVYAPEVLTGSELPRLPGELVPLARRALVRVIAEDSEWRDLWEDAGTFPEALAVIDDLRADLGGSAG